MRTDSFVEVDELRCGDLLLGKEGCYKPIREQRHANNAVVLDLGSGSSLTVT